MRRVLICLLVVVFASATPAADSTRYAVERRGLEHLMEYLHLRPDDITYRSDYTEPDSFRLKVVADLMRKPLGMIDYTEGLRNAHVKGQPEVLARYLFADLLGEYQQDRQGAYQPNAEELQRRQNLYYNNGQLNQVLTRAATYINIVFPRSTELAFGPLSKKQQRFLRTEFKELVTVRDDEEFLSAETLDSLEKKSERDSDTLITFGMRFRKDHLIAAGIDCVEELMPEIDALRKYIDSVPGGAQSLLKTGSYLPANVSTESYLGKQPGWKIGGPGDDRYTGDYSFILDLGGNDSYELTYDPEKPHGVIIIDVSGNDNYRGGTDFALASGCFSTGILLDYGGDDRYDAKSFALGSGYFGFGLLYDRAGNDRYDGDTHVQGAGSFGLGVLVDEAGRDIYNAAVYSQGFGFVQGLGIICELEGSDSYFAGGKYKDVLRYDDHYLSLSQGFGYGIRPTLSGGIGAIVDKTGNDYYIGDIFAQGASYWWSLGAIYDSTGNDSYQAFQYGQGAATHMTLGIMVDDFGNDAYFGKGLMQGCGHDYSAGIMIDRHGNDTYSAYDLSQGAGSANGAGLLIDSQGDDRYFIKNPGNSQGFGDSRRDFGSIGLMLDLGGVDQHVGNGRENYYWRTKSRWGGGMDLDFAPKDTTQASK